MAGHALLRPALIAISCAIVVCFLDGVATAIAPWLDERAAARTYPYVAQLSGAVLMDGTGNPLRFRTEADAKSYAFTYQCFDTANSSCSADMPWE